MMLRVIIELKEIWCVFIERKMECRTSPAGHGWRQLGALWGWWLAAVVAGVHGGGSHVAPRRVGSGCRWQALARRRGENRRQWVPRHVGSGMAASLLALWDGSWAQWVLAWDVGAAGPGEGPGGAGGDAPSVSLARHGWTYGSRGCSPTRLPLATQPPTD